MIYKSKAQLLIVNLDNYQKNDLEIIKTIQSQEYLPIIYIYSNPYSKEIKKLINSENIVAISKLKPTLKKLIKKSISFKRKYNQIIESYDAIDLINNQIDKILKEYIASNFSNYQNSIAKLLNSVFITNDFLSNKPQLILTVFKDQNHKITEMYNIQENSVEKDPIPIVLKQNEQFDFEIQPENKFFHNYNTNEMSDIGDYRQIFPEKILDRIGEIDNFSGYTTTDTIIFAINYKHRITSFDADIIKTLCINFNLIKNIYNQFNRVNETFIYTINCLSRAAEVHDDDTGIHIKRVNEYSKLISENLGMKKGFIEKIYYSAQMHDVGKIHVPNKLLCKTGKLSDEEFKTIQNHTIHGKEILGDSSYLEMAADISLNHHECFDGSGYPKQKKGDEIPLSARIVMLADIYDALRSPRAYKPPFSHQKTYDIITNGDGRVEPEHFDPEIHSIFLKKHQEFAEIYNELTVNS